MRTCKRCAADISHRFKLALYCSTKCRNEYHRVLIKSRKPPRYCHQCGEVELKPKCRTCEACQIENKKPPPRHCHQCGKVELAPYCRTCTECRIENRSIYVPKPLTVKECNGCGVVFMPQYAVQAYCTDPCKNSAASKRAGKRKAIAGREKLRQQLSELGYSDYVIREFGFEPEEVREP